MTEFAKLSIKYTNDKSYKAVISDLNKIKTLGDSIEKNPIKVSTQASTKQTAVLKENVALEKESARVKKSAEYESLKRLKEQVTLNKKIISNTQRLVDIDNKRLKTLQAQNPVLKARANLVKTEAAASSLLTKGQISQSDAFLAVSSAQEKVTKAQYKMNKSTKGYNNSLLTMNKLLGKSIFNFKNLVAVVAAKSILDVNKKYQAVTKTLESITGSTAGAAAEMEYITGISDKFGLSILDTAKSYSQLLAASKTTTLSLEETRDIFTAVSRAGQSLGLSADDMSGALRAVTQIMSKGKVQAEELRGQLGERIPGAFSIAAVAMGKTTAELSKMLEEGKVLSDDFLPKFADALNTVITPAPGAFSTLTSEFNRFFNKITNLVVKFGESGFNQSIINLTREFGNALDNLEPFVIGLSKLFKVIVDNLGPIIALVTAYNTYIMAMTAYTKAVELAAVAQIYFSKGLSSVAKAEQIASISTINLTKVVGTLKLALGIGLVIGVYKLIQAFTEGERTNGTYRRSLKDIATEAETTTEKLKTMSTQQLEISLFNIKEQRQKLEEDLVITKNQFVQGIRDVQVALDKETSKGIWDLGIFPEVDKAKIEEAKRYLVDIANNISKVSSIEDVDAITVKLNSLIPILNDISPNLADMVRQIKLAKDETNLFVEATDGLSASSKGAQESLIDIYEQINSIIKKQLLNEKALTESSKTTRQDEKNIAANKKLKDTVDARYESEFKSVKALKDYNSEIEELDKLLKQLEGATPTEGFTEEDIKKTKVMLEALRAVAKVDLDKNAEPVKKYLDELKDKTTVDNLTKLDKRIQEIVVHSQKLQLGLPAEQKMSLEEIKTKAEEIATAEQKLADGIEDVNRLESIRNKIRKVSYDTVKNQRDEEIALLKKMGATAEEVASLELYYSEKIRESRNKEIELSGTLYERTKLSLDKLTESYEMNFSDINNVITSAFSGMEDSLVNFVKTGKLEFGSLVDSILEDILRLTIQQSISSPLASAASSILSSFVASAKGSVFSGGNVVPFASGGVVTSPTLFNMSGNNTGLMGEAGPEAIVPLTRTSSGELGIKSTGAANSNVQVNIIDQRTGGTSGEGVTTQESTGAGGQKTIDVFIVDTVKRGFDKGTFDTSLNKNFGAKRKAQY